MFNLCLNEMLGYSVLGILSSTLVHAHQSIFFSTDFPETFYYPYPPSDATALLLLTGYGSVTVGEEERKINNLLSN